MKQCYEFIIEEKWVYVNNINISEDFIEDIIKSKVKLVEIKKDMIKFIYVGVITYKDEILIVLPKYYDEEYEKKLSCITKLINVFKKLPKSVIIENKDCLFISKNLEDEYISEIAIADYIIKDFIHNGYYIKKDKIYRMNANGKVDWKKTINETQPIISNRYPIYNDVYNIDISNNQNDFISRIHKFLVEYSISKYASILGYNIKKYKLYKIMKNLQSLGSRKYILYKLQKELENTYNDRNIKLIKVMYTFFNPTRNKVNNNLSLFGTNSFETIWEFVCGYVFQNQYEVFKHLIPNPKWRAQNFNEISEVSNSRNMLKPDIIRMHNNTLMILDAKYYSIKINKKRVTGNPGTYDIIKQYVYEIALGEKIQRQQVINLLIYPKSMNNFYDIFGSVRLEIFKLKPILNVYISPKHLWDMYIDENYLSELTLDEIITKCYKYY